MRKGIYPGSFDPITNGHLDVLARAANLFDEVIVAVAQDNQKECLFTVPERVAMLEETARELRLPNVSVVSDFEFEFQMALMNRKLDPRVETIFLTPREELTYISSRIVKEIARLGGNVQQFVPAGVALALKRKLAQS
jgi:pantetheine-phosphate adenylyltransferase